MLDVGEVQNAMALMEFPASRKKDLLRKTEVDSAEALVHMHRVRNSRTSIEVVNAGNGR